MITYSRHLTSLLAGCKKLTDYWDNEEKYRFYDFSQRYDLESHASWQLFYQIIEICCENQITRSAQNAFQYLDSSVLRKMQNFEYIVPYNHSLYNEVGLSLSWGELIGLIMYALESDPYGGAGIQALSVLTPVPLFLIHFISQMRRPVVRHFYFDKDVKADNEARAAGIFFIKQYLRRSHFKYMRRGMEKFKIHVQKNTQYLLSCNVRKFSHYIDDYQLWFDHDFDDLDGDKLEKAEDNSRKCDFLSRLNIKHYLKEVSSGFEALSGSSWGTTQMAQFVRESISKSVNKGTKVIIEGFGQLDFDPAIYANTRSMTRNGTMNMTPAHCYYFTNKVCDNSVVIMATDTDYRVMARSDMRLDLNTRIICLQSIKGGKWGYIKLSQRGEKELKIYFMEEHLLNNSFGTNFFYEERENKHTSKRMLTDSVPYYVDPSKHVCRKFQPSLWYYRFGTRLKGAIGGDKKQ